MYQTDRYRRRDHIRKLSNLWQTRFRLRHLWFQLPRHLRNWPIPMSNRVSPSRLQPIRWWPSNHPPIRTQRNFISVVKRDSFKIKMRNRVGSNANASEMEIATSEELKIFTAKSTTISSHVSFQPRKFDPLSSFRISDRLPSTTFDPRMTLNLTSFRPEMTYFKELK